MLVCDTGDGNEGGGAQGTHLRVEVADKQDADTSGERRESNSGSPGEGQGGQGSRQSGDRQTCRGEDHWGGEKRVNDMLTAGPAALLLQQRGGRHGDANLGGHVHTPT